MPAIAQPSQPRAKWAAMIQRIILRFDISVHRWRRNMSGCAWQVYHRDGRVVNWIEAPIPKTPISLAIFLHEVGHHVQNLLGTSEQVRAAQQRAGETQANALSVQLELQADCYAGVWAHHADRARQVLEAGDVQEGLAAAAAIGDDRLQQQTQGRVVPESFTHGSSKQRVEWFSRGLETGSLESCDTFRS